MTLDDAVRLFSLPAASHLHLDLDGSEEAVMTGATEQLRDPGLQGILVTVDESRPAESVEALLAPAGWRLAGEHLSEGGQKSLRFVRL